MELTSYNLPLREVKAHTLVGADTEIREECYPLTWFPWLAQLAFLHITGTDTGVSRCTLCLPHNGIPIHT